MAPEALDSIIHQPTRLRIMVLLYQNRQAAATWVRDALGLTDGNLGSHAERLVQAGYVEQGRVLTAEGFQLRLRITAKGDVAFGTYLQTLQGLIRPGAAPSPTGAASPSTDPAHL